MAGRRRRFRRISRGLVSPADACGLIEPLQNCSLAACDITFVARPARRFLFRASRFDTPSLAGARTRRSAWQVWTGVRSSLPVARIAARRENQIKMIRLLSVTSPALIRYSKDSDDIEREIASIERERPGCLRRDDEFTNVSVIRRPLNSVASRMRIPLLMFPGLCAPCGSVPCARVSDQESAALDLLSR